MAGTGKENESVLDDLHSLGFCRKFKFELGVQISNLIEVGEKDKSLVIKFLCLLPQFSQKAVGFLGENFQTELGCKG